MGVGRPKQWAEGVHPAEGIWLAGCQLHRAVIYRAHLTDSTYSDMRMQWD